MVKPASVNAHFLCGSSGTLVRMMAGCGERRANNILTRHIEGAEVDATMVGGQREMLEGWSGGDEIVAEHEQDCGAEELSSPV